MLFGNYAGMTVGLSSRVGFGSTVVAFPGVDGRIDGAVVTYSLIAQQPTVVGALGAGPLNRALALAGVLRDAGFPTRAERDVEGWLASHAALVVPMVAAIAAAGGSADALAGPAGLTRPGRMPDAGGPPGRSAARAVSWSIANLRLPTWSCRSLCRPLLGQAPLRGEFGELAFAAHTRHA